MTSIKGRGFDDECTGCRDGVGHRHSAVVTHRHHSQLGRPSMSEAGGKEDEDDDELDKLLNSYDDQAQSDLAAVQAAAAVKQKQAPKSMKSLREEGLATPLSPNTK